MPRKGGETVEIVIKITDSEVKQALEEYGYEVTNQRVADVMETIATSRYVDTDEIIRAAIETLADEQDWPMAKM
jgi:Ca2+-binding EF-hand superfamily protein